MSSAQLMAEQSGEGRMVGGLLLEFLTAHGIEGYQYKQLGERAGLDRTRVARIVAETDRNVKHDRSTLIRLADAIQLTDDERERLEAVAGYPNSPGFLRRTEPVRHQESGMSLRRGILLLTAPTDPSRLPASVARSERASVRSGVVFGPHDVVVRVTAREGSNIFAFADALFSKGPVRTMQTIPLRDDMPIYLDKDLNAEYYSHYILATIFVEALGGPRKPEFPELLYEVAMSGSFAGGLRLLTAAVTVGQYDSVVEVLAANREILQRFVREAQAYALKERGREAHMITYFATDLWCRHDDMGF
jgi:uncharacterized protein with GYD domain